MSRVKCVRACNALRTPSASTYLSDIQDVQSSNPCWSVFRVFSTLVHRENPFAWKGFRLPFLFLSKRSSWFWTFCHQRKANFSRNSDLHGGSETRKHRHQQSFWHSTIIMDTPAAFLGNVVRSIQPMFVAKYKDQDWWHNSHIELERFERNKVTSTSRKWIQTKNHWRSSLTAMSTRSMSWKLNPSSPQRIPENFNLIALLILAYKGVKDGEV